MNDPIPRDQIDLLALVAHGATEMNLTNGARAVTEKALEIILTNKAHNPIIGFAAYSASADPSIETDRKARLLEGFGSHLYFGGLVFNTIMECIGIKNAIPANQRNPPVIVVVTDEAHSRRCRIVWKVFFPESRIYISAVPITVTVDPQSPMFTYRKLWKILWNQAWPIVIFKPLSWFGERGLMLLANAGQPSVKKPATV